MPKVLHINTSDRHGGAEEFALFLAIKNSDTLIVKTKQTSHDEVIEFPDTFLDKMFLFVNKILWKLGEKRKLKQLLFWSDRFNCTYRKLSRLKAYKEADIIHLHNIHGGFFDLRSLRKMSKDKKIVWTIHDLWLLTGGEAYVFENDDFITGHITSSTLDMYALNNPIFDFRKKYIDLKKNIIGSIEDNLVLCPPGRFVKSLFEKAYTIPSSCKMEYIHYGVDCELFVNEDCREWNVPRVLMLNSISEFKNSKLIYKELKKFDKEIELHSFGSPLDKSIFFDGKIKVIDHGYIDDRSVVKELYNSIDIFLFSTFQENFPLVSVEASACGVFVLASDIGPTLEQSALFPMKLFDNNIPGSLNTALLESCVNLNETRALGKRASLIVHDILNRNVMLKKYDEIYTKLLD